MSIQPTLLLPREEIEPGAQRQIQRVCGLPWVKAVAIMPDVHQGYDLTIGGVALTEGVISPSFVGYDIGCGMCCLPTGRSPEELGLGSAEAREALLEKIRAHVPMGLGGQRQRRHPEAPVFKSASGSRWLSDAVNGQANQFGSLGSGNHFIEIGVGQTSKQVYVTLHTGSRKPGHLICEHYLGAYTLCLEDPNDEACYFELDSPIGQAYWQDLLWTQEWALGNRKVLMRQTLGLTGFDEQTISDMMEHDLINENHNHAQVNEDGTVLHRKGATPAEAGQLGVIPGSAAFNEGVFLTRGLGNKEALVSAPHGAGRAMSRGQARRRLTMEDMAQAMGDVTYTKDPRVIDEAPQAYKDVSKVIERCEGVVIEVIEQITPIISVKGV